MQRCENERKRNHKNNCSRALEDGKVEYFSVFKRSEVLRRRKKASSRHDGEEFISKRHFLTDFQSLRELIRKYFFLLVLRYESFIEWREKRKQARDSRCAIDLLLYDVIEVFQRSI